MSTAKSKKEPTVLHGMYGYYYPYKDETTGKSAGLKVFDYVYEKYYKPGYLKDQNFQEMLDGKTISFRVPITSGGYKTITAKVIPYTTSSGRNCKIIQFDSEENNKIEDYKVIDANAEKIATSYWTGTKFDYVKPQEVVNKLSLECVWKTFSTNCEILGTRYGIIKLYRQNSRKDDNREFYIKIINDESVYITPEQYKADLALDRERNEKLRLVADEMNAVIKKCKHNINAIYDAIFGSSSSLDYKDLSTAIETFIAEVKVDNIDGLVLGLVNSDKQSKDLFSSYFINARTKLESSINVDNYNYPDAVKVIYDDIISSLLKNMYIFNCYLKLKIVRCDLYDEYSNVGLEKMTEHIDIDNALSLGYFHTVQKVLLKYKADSPAYIIKNMFKDEINPTALKDKIMNLLKIFYDFYDMPAKDLQSIAKYIAKNKLSDYYAKISEFDEVLETLIDNSRDPRLTKPLIEGIVGTPKARVLKDKTYYFEKRGRLRKEIKLYKPIELVDELRKHLKEFNASSGVALLTNIELDADESFIFQFYTFAEAEGDEKGFDGRRMLNLTRIYNRYHSKDKIGFVFENEDSTIDDTDDTSD